jgi:hypothetical protein
MPPKLPYLVAEISAAMEVYLSGRIGQQYNRTAFILCDDCAELCNKLFLLTDTPTWSDRRSNNSFKNFREVAGDVRGVFQAKRAADHAAADALLQRIEARRDRRNKFFHSTDLLDLNLQPADCVRAFVDLLDYGKLLFGADWDSVLEGVGNMETCEAVLRVDKKSYSDPSVGPKMDAILRKQPRLGEKPVKKGCEVAHHPEDIHLRLAIRNGNKEFRDKLRALL